ncbi:MAG: DUF6029 family protein [bacterium]
MRRLLGAFAALCAVAAAAELSISGVNRAEFWAFFDSVYSTHTEDKLDLTVSYGDLAASAGMFLYEPSKPWAGLRQPMRLLDYTVAYSPEQLEVLYGKFYQTFGRGLALRAYEDDDFRHYKSLHGLRGTAHLPLGTDVVLLGARLRDIFFQENTYKTLNAADSTNQVLGADLSSRPVQWAGFGGRYVRINGDGDLSPRAFNELYGGDLSATVGPVDVYGEICQRLGTRPGIGGRETGLGYYVSGTLSFPGYSLLGEYMDYDKLGYPTSAYHYNDPPTPIKSGVAIDRGVDERGWGVTATASPLDPLYLEANYGWLYRHEDSTTGVYEWEGKGRYSLGENWTFEAKLNHMVQQNIELHVARRGTTKPTILVNHLAGEHTFTLEADYNWVVEDTGNMLEPWRYHETALVLSYGYGDALLFTVGWQAVDLKLDRRYNGQQSWPVFETVWTITERNILRVRVGAERGGYTCSGGVCRFESPFTGVKAQLISRF